MTPKHDTPKMHVVVEDAIEGRGWLDWIFGTRYRVEIRVAGASVSFYARSIKAARRKAKRKRPATFAKVAEFDV